ncbi:hypothetical protein [Nocardia miyunensis]|uniref:hypothetical protein n=1 Tax=Nocardia miyunensis TaxID=282684 RepID=UPI00082AFE33|nr:hypothetical protein [Nocardia miyunensis]
MYATSKLAIIRPEQGAEPLVHLATTADAVNGKYFHRLRPEEPRNAPARDAELAQGLWAMSEKLAGVAFPSAQGSAASVPPLPSCVPNRLCQGVFQSGDDEIQPALAAGARRRDGRALDRAARKRPALN